MERKGRPSLEKVRLDLVNPIPDEKLAEVRVGDNFPGIYPTPVPHEVVFVPRVPNRIRPMVGKDKLRENAGSHPIEEFTLQEESQLLRLTDKLLEKIGQFGRGLGVRRTATLVLAASMLAGCLD